MLTDCVKCMVFHSAYPALGVDIGLGIIVILNDNYDSLCQSVSAFNHADNNEIESIIKFNAIQFIW